MTNKKPIATDLQVLEGFAEDFLVDDMPRDERMAQRWNCSVKQVHALWSKKRFSELIDYGTSINSGWLTEKGKAKLLELQNESTR